MSRARVLAAIAAWLVVVAGATTLVWTVISRAGEQVVSSEQPLVATTGGAEQPSGSSPPASRERRTWQGLGGLVIAACDRGAVRLVSAQPIDGFHAEIKDDGPDELEVKFEGRDDEEGHGATVVARCVSDVPDFTSQVEDD